ncbi:ABC-2 type transport system permease protein [Thermocatellispora tengchongensis]|uniref:Transport permease protein n=1 Tax=Thermocatellispora tengchongensis TaxID=1073253 RepID=A0A840PQG6_9ACTN|nr:ABC transporter permease [Thermocatellispora tengchongensis]MBB5138235.1 ABC-2 type transport system permease protein [Thermocatellispora tengchongensis]
MLKHTMLFLGYELRSTLRNPIWPLFGVLQPVLYLLLFAPLLANTGAVGASQAEALEAFTPGVMMMVALFGSLFVGFGMIYELREGYLERLAVSQVWRPAIVLGRTLRDVVQLIVQALLVVGLAALMGMRADPIGLLLMLLLMAVVGMLASGLSYGMALAVRDENGMSQIMQFFAMPLILLTGILLPMSLAPQWMQTVALFNPLYHAVEAGRALFAGDLGDGSIPLAFGLTLVLAVLALTWSVRSMRRLAG